jgi:malate dehydrogenase (oxaloacetate-decarboxylating)(NADP+)
LRKITAEEALEYHSRGRKGKIEVVPSKPTRTAEDLSLAYSPGVAEPCLVIAKDPEKVYEYTTKGNLVAVVSNGTAVLGLGNIGPLAAKPVMEGKGVLFKRFADIDVFDIEVDAEDPDVFIETVARIAPTFGGINLEDIKAPECFEIEEKLKKRLAIPVFHDDQHGTAIITAAALLNALEVVGKKIDEVKVVFIGAGASAIACARLYLSYGVRKENLRMIDKSGVLYEGRSEDMNPYKAQFAISTGERTLADALQGADVLVGLSTKGTVTGDLLKAMARDPIVFALANPDPEITPEEARAARPDVIMATGRSDYPNQVNNVLGFPFIFRGALDVAASEINEAMKMAASQALAALAKMDVPTGVPDPDAVRLPRPAVGRSGGRRSRDGLGRGPQADYRHGGVLAQARVAPLPLARAHGRRDRKGPPPSEADRFSRRGASQDPAGRQDSGRGGNLPARPPGP